MQSTVIRLQPKAHLRTLFPFEKQRYRFVVATASGHEIINKHDVIYIASDSNYAQIHFAHRKPLLCSKTLKAFAAVLEPMGFWRIHQKYLVNPDYLVRLSKIDGMHAEMEDGAKLDVSRARRKEVLENLGDKFEIVGSK